MPTVLTRVAAWLLVSCRLLNEQGRTVGGGVSVMVDPKPFRNAFGSDLVDR